MAPTKSSEILSMKLEFVTVSYPDSPNIAAADPATALLKTGSYVETEACVVAKLPIPVEVSVTSSLLNFTPAS